MEKLIKPNNSLSPVDLSKLDDSQAAAVKSDAEKILLRAPAGSGKTNSLINAIINHRYEYINDRICAITYTRAARAEMEARLQEANIFDVEVTTIHVWSRNLLNELAIKYGFKVNILEAPKIKFILREIIDDYLKTSKLHSINIDIVYSFITGNKNMDVTERYARALQAIERRYIQYKRLNVLYDFTDYPLYLYDMLVLYDEYINDIDALFIDEFQDVDATQFKIFERVNCRKKFAVGDAWQSIFQFRGADGEVFKKAKDFTEYKLRHNYRSYQEIIDYACKVYINFADDLEYCEHYIGEIMTKRPSGIECARGQGGFVYVINPYGRAVRIHMDKTDKIEPQVAFEDMLKRNPMILCRTNKQVKALQGLGYFNCSTIHQAKGLEYNDVIVADMMIPDMETLNVAYVALTRARNRVLVVPWARLEQEIIEYLEK